MRVLKFGGKSLETKEKFEKICHYIKSIYKKDKQIVVVVSAIGDTTNELIKLSEEFGNNKYSNRELSSLLSTGETQSASLFAMHLNSINIPAKSFSGKDIEITTFGDYNNGKVVYLNKSKILSCLNDNVVAVVAGFQGVNKFGEITTLGRGGSDTTAVAISTVLGVNAEIFSDYNGIFSGDPKLNNFKKLKKIDYDSMMLMANAGAKVLDYRATALAKKFSTPIISKSSEKPNLKGTIISELESDIISISSRDNLCKLSVIFSNESKIEFIYKNVINILKNYNFYNFTQNKNIIEFLIEQKDKLIIINELSTKLNLIK